MQSARLLAIAAGTQCVNVLHFQLELAFMNPMQFGGMTVASFAKRMGHQSGSSGSCGPVGPYFNLAEMFFSETMGGHCPIAQL